MKGELIPLRLNELLGAAMRTTYTAGLTRYLL
jgi:hypothetical protein